MTGGTAHSARYRAEKGARPGRYLGARRLVKWLTPQQIAPVASTASPPAIQGPTPPAAVIIVYNAAHITSTQAATIGPPMTTARIVDKDSSLRSTRVAIIAASSAGVRLIP